LGALWVQPGSSRSSPPSPHRPTAFCALPLDAQEPMTLTSSCCVTLCWCCRCETGAEVVTGVSVVCGCVVCMFVALLCLSRSRGRRPAEGVPRKASRGRRLRSTPPGGPPEGQGGSGGKAPRIRGTGMSLCGVVLCLSVLLLVCCVLRCVLLCLLCCFPRKASRGRRLRSTPREGPRRAKGGPGGRPPGFVEQAWVVCLLCVVCFVVLCCVCQFCCMFCFVLLYRCGGVAVWVRGGGGAGAHIPCTYVYCVLRLFVVT
jgi:hypothetical protein